MAATKTPPPKRVHLEKLNTPLQPEVDAGLREHAKHSPIVAAEMRKTLEEPTTECGQGVGVPLDIFTNHAREARCQKCNGKAGNPAPAVRTGLTTDLTPMAWETARTLVRVLQRGHPTAHVPPRLAVEFAVSAIVKTIDNERDAVETVRRYVERDGALTDEADTAAVLAEVCTGLAKRLNKAPKCTTCREGGTSCVRWQQREGKGFGSLDVSRMCDACAAMWHVSMAEVVLRRRALDDAEDAARAGSKAEGVKA